jgi:hypothetical protein
MIEKPSSGRAQIFKTGNNLEIQIPTKKSWPGIIFLSLWLCGWLVGEIFSIRQLIIDETPLFTNLFLLIWVIFWTIGGAAALFTLLWLIAGIEIIKVENGIFEIQKKILGWIRTKEYQISEIRVLSVNPLAEGSVTWGKGGNGNTNTLKFDTGSIKFCYGAKTLKFGAGIDQAEGQVLIDYFKLNSNFKPENFE